MEVFVKHEGQYKLLLSLNTVAKELNIEPTSLRTYLTKKHDYLESKGYQTLLIPEITRRVRFFIKNS